ncbi:hypothetical protein O181_024798 [Austropuccinia psidii MF-1]|uniref:Reverse transcriptase Ty1/copia-type domain-containing protein n=1 Tax=Austropuccinia psidii MF-1 TaxID=1389203 RepID=A0A9Q3CLF7_9BASI|nr:hypothetical protein [Austropuccinia psidii MF-1]
MEKARWLILTSKLPSCYWAEAVIVYTPRHQRKWRLAPVGDIGIVLGFSNDSAYRILKIKDKKVYTSRHIVFFKNDFPSLERNPESDNAFPGPSWNKFSEDQHEEYFYCNEEPEELEPGHPNNSEIESESESESSEDMKPRSKKRIKVIGPGNPTLINSNIDKANPLPYSRGPAAHLTHSDPNTYKESLNSFNSDLWANAISKELNNMITLNVWEETSIEKGYKLVGTTWVFKTKKNKNHEIIEYKARLCAQGFSQTHGVDFSKTFALTERLNSLHTLISHAASEGLKFEQLDIKSAFLNAPLEEDVYLSIPQGLDRNKRTDSCVLYLDNKNLIWLFLHVDDIGIFGKNLTKVKTAITSEFSTKMMGLADLILGIKITHHPNSITLSQSHYIDSLLGLYGISECKPIATPLIPNSQLKEASDLDQVAFLSLNINYCSTIGSLSYLSTATRPNLSFLVSTVSQFLESPGIHPWKEFIHVLK